MKRAVLLLLLLAPLALLASGEPDAVFTRIDVAYTVNGDGSWVMEYHHRVRLQSYMAFNRALGESFIVYNPDFQKLEILKSETTMAGGKKVASPANAFNEVLPFAAHGFPAFSHLREMVVTHVGLERGAEIEFAYRLSTQAGFLPFFSAREILGRPFPVEALSVTVAGPLAGTVRFAEIGAERLRKPAPAPGEKASLSFAYRDLPALVNEGFGREGDGPQLVLSAAPDWARALPCPAGDAPLPESLQKRADAAARANPGLPEKLAALHKLVASAIANCRLGVEQTGWRVRTPAEIWNSNYATPLEKRALLARLLKRAGIAAEPLGVAHGLLFADDVPAPQQLGSFLLRVREDGHSWYLPPDNAQAEFAPCPYPGRKAWNFAGKEIETLPAESGAIEIGGQLELQGAQAKGTLTVLLAGIFQRPRLAAENPKGVLAQALGRVFPAVEVTSVRVLELTPSRLRAEVAMQTAWPQEPAEGVRLLPALRIPPLSEEMVSAPDRQTPLHLEGPFHFALRLQITPEKGWRPAFQATAIAGENSLGKSVRRVTAGADGSRVAELGLDIPVNPVSAAQYPLLQELARPLLSPDTWLIFQKQ